MFAMSYNRLTFAAAQGNKQSQLRERGRDWSCARTLERFARVHNVLVDEQLCGLVEGNKRTLGIASVSEDEYSHGMDWRSKDSRHAEGKA